MASSVDLISFLSTYSLKCSFSSGLDFAFTEGLQELHALSLLCALVAAISCTFSSEEVRGYT